MQLTVIEGNRQKLDGGAMFGNAPKALWQRWVDADELNRIPMACRCLLLTTDSGKHILFETGIGNFFEPALKSRYGVAEEGHQLLLNLQQHGLTDADIDVVVLSHLHFDHAGGLLSSYREGEQPQLLFPNAVFISGKAQWQHAQAPHLRDRASYVPLIQQLLQDSRRLLLVDEANCDSALEGVRFHFSDGHTPGLMLSEIATARGPLLFASDLIPGSHWVHLPICMGYDRYPEKLIDEKRQMLDYLLQQQGRLFFTHDDKLACGLVHKDDSGRYSVMATEIDNNN